MLKYIYRVIILIAVFIGALYYFSGDIKEVVFHADNTTVMEDATFPLVTIRSGENSINLLHGYSTNLSANLLRESVIPLNTEKTFEAVIDQEEYEIKKLNFEVREFVGDALIEDGSVSVFEEEGNQKTARIKLTADLDPEKEYAVKLTLISSDSDKMYYYQRIKIYDNAHLKEKLDFIMDFHNAIMDRNTAESVKRYLEPSNLADNSSLSCVNINSSFDLITWGSLQPKILTDIVPTVKEIYSDTASVELEYFMEAEIAGKPEQFRVVEFYRVRYATDRMYLLNYERRMEAEFDTGLASLAENDLKLGITSDTNVPVTSTSDQKKLAFVRNRELWFYDLENNEITKVFSFRQKKTEYLRDLYDQHDIRILNMDEEGNLDFLVYGYMNRGQYEGRVAIILYRFLRGENRVEERLYMPVEEPYATLKENLGSLTYVNSMDIFYFQVYNNIYSYDLTTRKLTEIAQNINRDQAVVLKDLNYVAWQDASDPKQSKNINIMNLESGVVETISAKQGQSIRLMDIIDSNIIYGYVEEENIASMMDGSIMAPMSSVEIASVDKKVLKSYSKEGYYISGLQVNDNVVALRRVKKVQSGGRTVYTLTSADYIMNQIKSAAALTQVIFRVTDEALKEYYLSMPKGFVMDKIPKVMTTVMTIIDEDPTLRLPSIQQKELQYYPYISGGIAGAYDNAADAIAVARDHIGVVLNNNEQLIWERGVKEAKNTIPGIETMNWSVSQNTVEECLRLLLAFQKVNVEGEDLSVDQSSAYDILKQYSKYTPVRLTGITLDDALYYVSVGRPVIALTDYNKAVLIYGYDTFNIMVVDPSKNKAVKMGIQDSAKLFEDSGNIFLTYLAQ